MSLRATSAVMAHRLATQLDAILEDAAMLAERAVERMTASRKGAAPAKAIQR
jgi:hypothetical protein